MIDAHLCDEDGHGDPQDPDAKENRSCLPGQDQRLEQEPADAQRRVEDPDKEECNGEKNGGGSVDGPQILQRISASPVSGGRGVVKLPERGLTSEGTSRTCNGPHSQCPLHALTLALDYLCAVKLMQKV